MRINKFFTDSGYCSRREADKLIEAGRVKINGRRAVLGDQVADADEVTLDGKKITGDNKRVYIMFNKPFGVTCTTDARIEGNIVEAVNHPLRVFPIGRLDKASTGLIFLTNDGEIVNKILRAQFGHEKEYQVQVNEPFPEKFLKHMANGVDIGGYITRPCKITRTDEDKFTIILTEGKNRQIRRMTDALGFKVKRLHRVRIMNVRIGDLASGEWRDISAKDLVTLKNTLAQQPEWKQSEEIDVEE